MESKSNTFDDENYKQEEELELEELDQEQQEEEENNEILKNRISNHPLYGLLIEAHLDCLKVCDISNLDRELKKEQKQAMKKQNLLNQSEQLDLFMEAYCLALNKLKEAMEGPQQNSMAFINNMHSQLRELTMATSAPAPTETTASTTSSPSDHECTFRRNPKI